MPPDPGPGEPAPPTAVGGGSDGGAGPRFVPWFGALVVRLPTVVRDHLPGRPLDARRRELVAAVAADAAGSPFLGRLHAAWHGVLGPAELSEADDELLAWVAATVGPLPRVDPTTLPDELDAAARDAVVATMAHGVVAALALERTASAAGRVTGARPRSVSGLAGDVAAAMAGLPLTVPVLAAGALADAIGRLAPARPPVEVGPDANLLAQLLAETLPTWLGSVWGRSLVAALPVEVAVAVRSGRSAATVRLGRGRVRVVDGVADDAWALFDGEIDGLLRAGTRSLSRELRAARLRG